MGGVLDVLSTKKKKKKIATFVNQMGDVCLPSGGKKLQYVCMYVFIRT